MQHRGIFEALSNITLSSCTGSNNPIWRKDAMVHGEKRMDKKRDDEK